MKPLKIKMMFAVMAMFALAAAPSLHAQAGATATQVVELSAWAGATGTYTGLEKGRNLGITAGADVSVRHFFGLTPTIEVRGTYPIHDGVVDAQEDVLGGLKLSKRFLNLHPYVNILYGRGEIKYEGGGALSPDGLYYYVQTPSNVFSPGAGVDVRLSPNFSLKADAQLQIWNTPVTTSGHIYAKPLTLGLVYRFDFNSYGRARNGPGLSSGTRDR